MMEESSPPPPSRLHLRWKYFVLLPSVIIAYQVLFAGSNTNHEFAVLSGEEAVGNRLDELGFDHDSKSALLTARKADKQVEMSLHTNKPYPLKLSWTNKLTCEEGKNHREPLPESMQEPLNFTTGVHTNLKVLFVGDWETRFISEVFEEASGVQGDARLEWNAAKHQKDAEKFTIGTTDDYGVVAGFFKDTLVAQDDQGNVTIFDLSQEDVLQPLLNYSMPWLEPVDAFDVLVLKLPQTHGLESLKSITQETLEEFTRQAAIASGVSTVIFITLPLRAGYETVEALMELKDANHRIWSFARNYIPEKGSSVHNVLTLDFDKFTHEVVAKNAQHMGMKNVSSIDDTPFSYLMERVNLGKTKAAVAHVCSEPKHQGLLHDGCPLNMFAANGASWCMETMGGRIVAGLSCLMECSMMQNKRSLEHCQASCNRQFMSLEKVDEGVYDLGP